MKAICVALVLMMPIGANAVFVCGNGFADSNLAEDTGFGAPVPDEFQVIGDGTSNDAPVETLIWLLIGQETEPRLGYVDAATGHVFVGDRMTGKNREMTVDAVAAWAPARVVERVDADQRVEPDSSGEVGNRPTTPARE